ncbi:hypothetical protein [Ilyobacter polytropus]|uniref:D-alanine-D-alanine ligase n=1 Tax=Ilyobacter polytropus (strain ATCC 51220 / DSM 2926 / LMG 16218 / CuHBu1) TaxID=572544 RepID=E3H8R3_ILYPC|nr:hypothetical protein [Ilyobacter polytropus]ADO83327.1 D-alanine-D-alanine ligase [Ilyobacter polytropus DSM 2926]
MKFIKILIVFALMVLAFKFYRGMSSRERDIGIDSHRKIYKKTEEKLNNAVEIQEKEYEKLKKLM